MSMSIKIDIFSIVLSVIALLISYLSFKEMKKARVEDGQASFTVELMRVGTSIYVDLHNIGKNHAYNFNFTINTPFPNSFINIHTIEANSHYRYELISINEIPKYPSNIYINISYNDVYSQIATRDYFFEFNLIDIMKYTVTYNSELKCYDINKFC